MQCARDGPEKREREESELAWRVRRPLCDLPDYASAPRVAPPARAGSAAPASQSRRSKRVARADALESIGLRAQRSKEQIDSLEKMLLAGMPPRVVLDNAFAGLRCAVAEEMESVIEVEMKRGMKLAESIASSEIAALQTELAQRNAVLAELQSDLLNAVDETVQEAQCPLPEWWYPQTDIETSNLAEDLARFLADLPPPESPDSGPEIDLDEMVSNLVMC